MQIKGKADDMINGVGVDFLWRYSYAEKNQNTDAKEFASQRSSGQDQVGVYCSGPGRRKQGYDCSHPNEGHYAGFRCWWETAVSAKRAKPDCFAAVAKRVGQHARPHHFPEAALALGRTWHSHRRGRTQSGRSRRLGGCVVIG